MTAAQVLAPLPSVEAPRQFDDAMCSFWGESTLAATANRRKKAGFALGMRDALMLPRQIRTIDVSAKLNGLGEGSCA